MANAPEIPSAAERTAPEGAFTAEQLAGSNKGVNPDTLQEILAEAKGYYVVCEFLIGTTGLEKREGILQSVGTAYFILFDPITKTSMLCDLYSIKFVTFYDKGQYPADFIERRMAYNSGSASMPSGRF